MDEMSVTIDRDYLVSTLADLVRINSVNPRLVPGAPGEAEIAAYVAGTLRDAGVATVKHEPEPGRVSLVATLQGQGGGRSLMLNGHLDTVGVAGMPDPFSGAVREGRLYGRGAYDMKGAVAACLTALKALSDAHVPLRGDVLFAGVADEEYASLGTADIVSRYHADGAIVTEASALDLCIAHKGFVWAEVETLGRAAHGSRFAEGVDANMRMGRFLTELETLERDLRARAGHRLVGPPSLHAAVLSGGSEPSTYAARCTLTIERRTVPGETEAQVVAELQAIVDRLAAADRSFRATVRSTLAREPFEVPSGAPIAQAVRAAARAVLGREPADIGQTYWMDSALLAAAGIETAVIGPRGAGEHSREEWVDLESLYDLAAILAQAAILYCG